MTTTTTQSLFRANDHIAQEFARTGRMVNPKSGFFPTKPKKPETVLAEKRQAAWERRSNQCQVCHTAKSVTGDCMC